MPKFLSQFIFITAVSFSLIACHTTTKSQVTPGTADLVFGGGRYETLVAEYSHQTARALRAIAAAPRDATVCDGIETGVKLAQLRGLLFDHGIEAATVLETISIRPVASTLSITDAQGVAHPVHGTYQATNGGQIFITTGALDDATEAVAVLTHEALHGLKNIQFPDFATGENFSIWQLALDGAGRCAAKYIANHQPADRDTGFGQGGWRTLEGVTGQVSMALEKSGSVILVVNHQTAVTGGTVYTCEVRRLLANGDFDPALAVTLSSSDPSVTNGGGFICFSVATASDGTIAIGGLETLPNATPAVGLFMLTLLSKTGAPIAAFNSAARVAHTSLATALATTAYISSLAFTPTGELVATGRQHIATAQAGVYDSPSQIFARYLPTGATPGLDHTFGDVSGATRTGWTRTVLPATVAGASIASQKILPLPGGGIFSVGNTRNGGLSTLWKMSTVQLSAQGAPTTSQLYVNTIPAASIETKSAVRQSDGRVVIVGKTYDTGDPTPLVVRVRADGFLDSTFPGGVMTPFNEKGGFSDVTLAADGAIIAVGTSTENAPHGIVARLSAEDGKLDTSFISAVSGENGKVHVAIGSNPSFSQVLELPDGRLLIAGTSAMQYGTQAFVTALVGNSLR